MAIGECLRPSKQGRQSVHTFRVSAKLSKSSQISQPKTESHRPGGVNPQQTSAPSPVKGSNRPQVAEFVEPRSSFYSLRSHAFHSTIQHSADCGLARFFRDARRCFWQWPTILSFCGFTASFHALLATLLAGGPVN